MTRIRLFDHPFSAEPPKVYVAACVAEWMLAHYGDAPRVTIHVFRGEPSKETDITGNVAALLDESLEVCTVLESPGLEAAAAWIASLTWSSFLTYAGYAVTAYNVYNAVFASRGTSGGLPNQTSASPNNALAGRNNDPRLRARIEDIYGTVLSIPPALMPPYQKRINNIRVEFGYYCVGRGYHDIDRVRDADTLISAIPGASAAVYAPFTSPNSGDSPQLLIGDPIIDPILTVRSANFSGGAGVALKAANQVQLAATDTYTFTPAAVAGATGDVITQANKRPNFNAIAEAGQDIVIGTAIEVVGAGPVQVTVDAGTNQYTDDTGLGALFAGITAGMVLTWSGFANTNNNGAHTVVSVDDANTITVSGSVSNETAPTVSFTREIDWADTRTIAVVGDGVIVLEDAQFTTEFEDETAITVDNGLSEWTAWVTITTPDRTEVWVTIVALQGMFKDSGGKALASVDFEIQIEELDADDLTPTANVETVTGTMSGQSSDELGQTIEHVTGWAGPCRVRMRRTTAFDYGFSGAVIDEIKWDNLSGVSPVDAEDFGQLTTIHTVTPGTVRATSIQARQLNCLASRLIPTYDGTAFSGVIDATGRHVSGTIHPTSKMVDIMAAVITDPVIGKRSIAEFDLAQAWAVQQALDAWDPLMGQFNYTFDSDNYTLENTLEAIANACFCIAGRQSGKTRVQLERAQSSSAALYTHRNKQPRAETLTRTFANDSDNDGVELAYRSIDTGQVETIRIPLDGTATKPRKIEIPGINYAQAYRRAWREYLKLQGRRLAIETGCTTDARMLMPNTRIDIVDNTRFHANDGEVVGQDGLTLRLSQPVAFKPSVPHSIVLMKRDGSVQGVTCTAGVDAYHVVLQSLPAEAIVTEGGPDGVRTIYSFAADEDRGKKAYLVTEIDPPKDGYVTVRAVNYSDGYYAMDDEEIPDEATVIAEPTS